MLFNLKSNTNLTADHKEELIIKYTSKKPQYITIDNIQTIEGSNPKQLLKLSIELLGMLLGVVNLKKYKL